MTESVSQGHQPQDDAKLDEFDQEVINEVKAEVQREIEVNSFSSHFNLSKSRNFVLLPSHSAGGQ